jgi:hypothetical protein
VMALLNPMLKMLSHAGNSATKSCRRQHCRGDLAMVQSRCRVMLATILSSHAHDDAAGVTWPRLEVDAESSWRQCCPVILAIVLSRQLGHVAM